MIILLLLVFVGVPIISSIMNNVGSVVNSGAAALEWEKNNKSRKL